MVSPNKCFTERFLWKALENSQETLLILFSVEIFLSLINSCFRVHAESILSKLIYEWNLATDVSMWVLQKVFGAAFYKTPPNIWIKSNILCNIPTNNYLFKFKGKKYEICPKLKLKTPERRRWRCFGLFIVEFEHISHLFLVFLILNLNK